MQMAGDALGVTRAAVEQRVRAGSLDGLKVGKTRWVSAASIMKQVDAEEAEVYKVRRYLERLASAGEGIDYGNLMSEFDMSSTIPADRKKIGRLLGKVSRQTWEERGVLLSVLVTRKGSHNPGPGFFDLAEELDDDYESAKSDSAYVNQQINEVFASYGFFG
jgi:hypothetical protein